LFEGYQQPKPKVKRFSLHNGGFNELDYAPLTGVMLLGLIVEPRKLVSTLDLSTWRRHRHPYKPEQEPIPYRQIAEGVQQTRRTHQPL
jgi:hypothetical protein